MIQIDANIPFIEPPEWAVLQRSLINLMDDAVIPVMERYVRGDGSVLWPTTADHVTIDGLDDAYESFHNWPLLYLIGGSDHLLEHSHLAFEGITRQFSHYDTGHGHSMVIKEYEQGYDWMHQGEGYAFFYHLCLADPKYERNAERARRYAGFYLNEDPDALNYDSGKKLIKCPHNGSMGPAFRNFDRHYTVYRYEGWKPWPLPYHDLPGINTVEDLKKPGMEELMGSTLVARMSRGDVPTNLGATSLVTNAYLFGGEDKYRDWVVEYTEAWMERTMENGGILPDNVGLSGKIGEYIDGKWWGGYYGWTWPHGWETMADAVIAAAENASLMCRDPSYMDFPRSQIDVLMGEGVWRGRTLHAPNRYNDHGWDGFMPMRAYPTTHLWMMTMEREDRQRLLEQRNYEADDWRRICSHGSKHGAGHEAAWISYLLGEYPEYPGDIMRHNLAQVHQRLAFMRDDQQNPSSYGDWYLQTRNPITVEGLLQLTMGGPLYLYNGGLQMARLRYFDCQRRRPGLPLDVAALVSVLEADRTVVELVNLSATRSRHIRMQAGVFGEHHFTRIVYKQRRSLTAEEAAFSQAHEAQFREVVAGQVEEREIDVDDVHFDVLLCPGAAVLLDLGMRRFVHNPSYANPW